MKPETIGEINIALTNLAEKIDSHMEASKEANTKLMECINTLNKTCDLTLQQALKTNGRVNTIEPLALDYQENRARIRGAVTLGAIVSTAIIGGTVLLGKLYVDSVKRDTADLAADMVYTKLINNLELEYENKSQSIKESKTSSKNN